MLYAIKDASEPSPNNYVNRSRAKWFYCDLKRATLWKSRAVAERNLAAVKRSLRTFLPDLEVVEISEKKYQKVTKGRFSVGDRAIHAEFASDTTHVEPFLIQEIEITKETPRSYITSDGVIWHKNKLNQLSTYGKFLLANEEEVESIKDIRTKEKVISLLKATDPRQRKLWQQILSLLDKVKE